MPFDSSNWPKGRERFRLGHLSTEMRRLWDHAPIVNASRRFEDVVRKARGEAARNSPIKANAGSTYMTPA